MRRHLLPVLRELGVSIAGVVDSDLSRAREAGHQLGAVAAASLTELAEVATIHAVVAACPPAAHEAVVHQAIRLGLPTLVEKPPAIDSCSLETMTAEASVAGVPVCIGMNYRNTPGFLALAAELEHDGGAEYIHVLHLATGTAIPSWKLEPVRAFMLAQAIHAVDQGLVLTGPSQTIGSFASITYAEGISATWLLKGERGTTCVHVGNAAPGFRNVVTAVRRDGSVAELRNLEELSLLAPAGRRAYREQRLLRSPFADVHDRMGYTATVTSFLYTHLDKRFGNSALPTPTYLADLKQVYDLLDDAVARSETLGDQE